MKLYLAGPMTGYKELNFPAFNAEAARLRALGYQVVNPAEINGDDPNAVWATEEAKTAHWRACMRADITALLTCDSVALLDGWTASKGARLEHHIAMEMGMAPRLAAFFVDAVEPVRAIDTCTRCGGAHSLSKCNWPLVPAPKSHMDGDTQKLCAGFVQCVAAVPCKVEHISRPAASGAGSLFGQHPIQPLITDQHGVIRFKRNAIVDHLAEGKLNDLAVMDFAPEDLEQFAQLIGYSLSGWGNLSYVTDEAYQRAAAQRPTANGDL
ncbi:MAG: DUF4406 domain-containing protein [Pseudomonadota bacterium]